jgi:parallel beta-helix repeat protein
VIFVVLLFGILFAASEKLPLPLQSTQSQIDQGKFNQDETLSLKESPYTFAHDVFVPSGVKLTIESGVKICFEHNVSLIINGSIKAIGTEDNWITFMSTNPTSDTWGTIRFTGGSSESLEMEYSEISNATKGISIENGQGKTLIENCNIHDNVACGLQLTSGESIYVRGNRIVHNGIGIIGAGSSRNDSNSRYPYDNYLSDIKLEANLIAFNSLQGVKFYSVGKAIAQIQNISLAFNTISNNNGNGVEIFTNQGGMGVISDITFTSNSIENNGKNGVQINSFTAADVIDFVYNISFFSNTVICNNQSGVQIKSTVHQNNATYDATFSNNTFIGNDKAVLIDQGVTSKIEDNIIEGNVYGIFYNRTQINVALDNNISSNTFGIFVSEEALVQAQNNYWGDSTGPYHPYINPQGKGNPVNGAGNDLVFIPFLISFNR